jgi:PAS domain S-box-containing protein
MAQEHAETTVAPQGAGTVRLATFPQYNPNPLLEIDRGGTVTYYNPATIAELEKLGAPFDVRALLPPDIGDIVQALAQGEQAQLYREVTLNGTVFAEDIQLLPQFDALRIYARDITPRVWTAEALRESERLLRLVIDNLPAYVSYVNADDLSYRFANRPYENFFGRPLETIIGRPVSDVIGDAYTRARPYIERALAGETVSLENSVNTPKGPRWVVTTYTPDRDTQGKIVGLFVFSHDVTEHKQGEEALRESEERYRGVVDTSPDAIALGDLSGRVIFCNQQAATLYGFESVAAALGQLAFDFIAPEDQPRAMENLHRTLAEGSIRNAEYTCLRRDGSHFACEMSSSTLLDAQGVPIGFVSIARDITERKRMETQLEQLAEQRAWLVRDSYHRVKNNLIVIETLLRMQANELQDTPMHKALQESQMRVRSMLLIHEQLHQSQDLRQVDLSAYLHKLARALFNAYQTRTIPIELVVEAQDISLDADTALSCGLIVNELISNALKHAFVGRERGRLHIAMCQVDDHYVLTVSDDGIGMPAEERGNKTSLGMQIVRTKVQDLGGEIELEGSAGTTWKITFAKRELVR